MNGDRRPGRGSLFTEPSTRPGPQPWTPDEVAAIAAMFAFVDAHTVGDNVVLVDDVTGQGPHVLDVVALRTVLAVASRAGR